LIISSRALTAFRIGFHANFVRRKKNKLKIRVDQTTVPIAGVVRLFAKKIISYELTVSIKRSLQPTVAELPASFY